MSVRGVKTESVQGGTYHIHHGPNLAQATIFLRQTPVTEPLVYVVVETPEGNIGRDFIYIFHEPAGTPIEHGPRPPLPEPVPSTTHCAWCGFYIEPIDMSSPMQGSSATVKLYLSIEDILRAGYGFQCKSCGLLQCGLCTDLATDASESERREARCRSCEEAMGYHLALPPAIAWTFCLQVFAKDGQWKTLVDPDPRSRVPMYCAVVHAAWDRLADVAQEQVFDKTQGFELPRRVVFFEGRPNSELRFGDAYGVIEEGSSEVRPYTDAPPRQRRSDGEDQ